MAGCEARHGGSISKVIAAKSIIDRPDSAFVRYGAKVRAIVTQP